MPCQPIDPEQLETDEDEISELPPAQEADGSTAGDPYDSYEVTGEIPVIADSS